jgi:hypothetical protein
MSREVSDQVLATHGDTGTTKLMADSGPGNAQLGTNVGSAFDLGRTSRLRSTSTASP